MLYTCNECPLSSEIHILKRKFSVWLHLEIGHFRRSDEIIMCVLSSFSRAFRLFATLWIMSPPDFSVHGILQRRILGWVAVPFTRDFPNPGIKLMSSMTPELQSCLFYFYFIFKILSHQETLKSYKWQGSNMIGLVTLSERMRTLSFPSPHSTGGRDLSPLPSLSFLLSLPVHVPRKGYTRTARRQSICKPGREPHWNLTMPAPYAM